MPTSTSTRLSRDIRRHIPAPERVRGYLVLDERDRLIWDAALPHLQVRNNDRHSLYAYGMAHALLGRHPEADAGVVLPAILLHDIGWSTVPDHEVLEAIAPGGGRHDLVRQHEVEGARIATGILQSIGYDPDRTRAIAAIIDGHDTRVKTLSIEDAIVQDSDKLWRITPDGLDVVCGWFELAPEEALRLCCARVHDVLHTDAARAMAGALAAIASIDLTPQRAAMAGMAGAHSA